MINLLPQNEKKILDNREKRKLILILEILGFSFFLCLILILVSTKIYIYGQVEAGKIMLERQKNNFEISEEKDHSEKIKEANKKFSELKTFYSSQVQVSEILQILLDVTPEGIYFNNLAYQKQQATSSEITLSGFSRTGDDLLKFKDGLDKEERFESAYFPPSTWIESENVDFNVKFKVLDETRS